MKVIDVRPRPVFAPHPGKGNMCDREEEKPFALKHFCRAFGMKLSPHEKSPMEKLFEKRNRGGDMTEWPIRKNSHSRETDELSKRPENWPGLFLGHGARRKRGNAAPPTYVLDGPCITHS